MSETGPREFWIDPNHEDECGDDLLVGDALKKHPGQGPLKWQANLIHVIEKSAYDALLAELAAEKYSHKQIMADRDSAEARVRELETLHPSLEHCDKAEKRIAELEAERDEQRDWLLNNDQACKIIKALENQLASEQAKVAELKAELKEWGSGNYSKAFKIVDLERQVAGLKRNNESLSADAAKVVRERDALQSRLEQSETKLAECERLNEYERSRFDQLMVAHKELKEKLKAAEGHLADLQCQDNKENSELKRWCERFSEAVKQSGHFGPIQTVRAEFEAWKKERV